MATRSSPTAACFIATAFLASHAHATSPASTAEPCDELMAALRTLASGTVPERWNLLDEPLPFLDELAGGWDDDALSPCADRATATLLRVLRAGPDDRIVARVMDGIDWSDADRLRPFLLEALSHPSPNIRRRAIAALAQSPDDAAVPLLQAIWRHEPRVWIRAEAARALARAGDGTFVDEFDRLAVDGDPLEADAALAAVIDLRDPRSVATLEAIAAGSDGESWLPAVSALVSWNDLPSAGDALLRLALSADTEIATRTIRKVAESGVADLEWLSRVRRLAETQRNPEVDELVSSLIDEITDGSESERITLSCGLSEGAAERSRPLVTDLDGGPRRYGDFVVRPESGAASARCWDGPGYANPTDVLDRVRAGTSLVAADIYEWDEDIWYLALGRNVFCWMPAGVLASADDEPEAAPEQAGHDRAPWEFDTTRDELATHAMRRAERAGFATVFEEDGDVVGVRLFARLEDAGERRFVLDTRDAGDGRLKRAIEAWLLDVEDDAP